MPALDPAAEFARALAKVLQSEGGYSNHPDDPGGPTMKGVTQRVYDAYRDRIGKDRRSVRLIETSELEAIYRGSYWDTARLDRIPAGVSYVVFDGNVNSGVKQSVLWLQRALGVPADGIVGPATIAAANSHPNHDQLVADILALRLSFMKALKNWPAFKNGWTARIADVKRTGQAWASDANAPAFLQISPDNGASFDSGASDYTAAAGSSAKAYPSDIKAAPSHAVADAATGGGIASGGLAATLQQVQDQLTPLSYSSTLVGKVVAGLIIVSALLTVGGLAYGFYARRKKARISEATDAQAPA